MAMTSKINSAVTVDGAVAHRVYKQFVRTLSSRTAETGETSSADVDFELQLYEETGWKLLDVKSLGMKKTDDGRELPVLLYIMYKEVEAVA